MRRNTEPWIFLLSACAMFYAFTYGAMRGYGISLRDDPSVLLRLGIPAIAALLALLLRNAWTGPEGRAQQAPAVDAAVAILFVLISQRALSMFSPELMLPRWAPTQGELAGWAFMVFLRAMFRPHPRVPQQVVEGQGASHVH